MKSQRNPNKKILTNPSDGILRNLGDEILRNPGDGILRNPEDEILNPNSKLRNPDCENFLEIFEEIQDEILRNQSQKQKRFWKSW